jgi:hypothetical protein
MCRGLGKVQRSILALIEAQPDEAWPVRDVAEQIYPGCAKPTRPQIDAVARALKTMPPPGKWKVGYVQGDRRRWLYDDVEAVARRVWRLEEIEVEVKPVARGELVQAMNGAWLELHELDELEPVVLTEFVLEDLPEMTEIVLTGLPDDDEAA